MKPDATKTTRQSCRRTLAKPAQAMGAVLIGSSLARWPATAWLLSPGWELADGRWFLILAVQGGAEAIFWFGVWLLGGKPLRDALARVCATRPVRAILARLSRRARPPHSRSGAVGA